jgi:hypothetical protein
LNNKLQSFEEFEGNTRKQIEKNQSTRIGQDSSK